MCDQTRNFTERDEFSDVNIIVEGTKLFVHRQYLAEWSGVWRRLFLTECTKSHSTLIEITLEDKALEDIIQLLQCIYSSQNYFITDSNVRLLLQMSSEYEMPKLKSKCEEYLLTQDFSIESLILAEKHDLKTLHKNCVDFAKTQTMEDLERHPLRKEIDPDTLIAIYKEKVYMMRNYADELKQSESTLKKQNEQMVDEKEGMCSIFNTVGKLWEMPNKRCYKHMTDEKFDFTCRDCNEKLQREVRRMCSEGQHVRRYFILNNKHSKVKPPEQ